MGKSGSSVQHFTCFPQQHEPRLDPEPDKDAICFYFILTQIHSTRPWCEFHKKKKYLLSPFLYEDNINQLLWRGSKLKTKKFSSASCFVGILFVVWILKYILKTLWPVFGKFYNFPHLPENEHSSPNSGGRYPGFLIEWISYWIESSQTKIFE